MPLGTHERYLPWRRDFREYFDTRPITKRKKDTFGSRKELEENSRTNRLNVEPGWTPGFRVRN